jgi:hypothetical protein
MNIVYLKILFFSSSIFRIFFLNASLHKSQMRNNENTFVCKQVYCLWRHMSDATLKYWKL